MRVIFMGSPPFSLPFLEALCQAGHEIAAVYSAGLQPRLRRGKVPEHCAVAKYAIEHGLNLCMPKTLKDAATIAQFQAWQADVAVVVAYGALLPEAILQAPKYGCLNVHPSLLPRWRGAAPIERAIAAGDHETGVMIMRMEAGLDTGAIGLSLTTPILQRNAPQLREHLAQLGSPLLVQALELLAEGQLNFTPQQGVPSYAHKITKEEARINWHDSAGQIYNQIRALVPFPGAWCQMRLTAHSGQQKIERVKILSSSLTMGAAPIEKICGDDSPLYILRCQKAGSREMSAVEFAKAYRQIELE